MGLDICWSPNICLKFLFVSVQLSILFMAVYVLYLWPSTTKWGPLRGVSKFWIIIHCNKYYFLHILMQKWLLIIYDIIQSSFTWRASLSYKDYNFFVFLWANEEAKCSVTPLFFHISIEKQCLPLLCFGMINIQEEYNQKLKILTFANIFACNSKNQFYCTKCLI